MVGHQLFPLKETHPIIKLAERLTHGLKMNHTKVKMMKIGRKNLPEWVDYLMGHDFTNDFLYFCSLFAKKEEVRRKDQTQNIRITFLRSQVRGTTHKCA